MPRFEGRKLRHELKYRIDPLEHRTLSNKLGVVMKRDRHAGEDGKYHIRSLYFDDFRNTALFEKQSGVARRYKYRIRIYDLKDDVIRFERKDKFDQYISKQSAALTREQAERMIRGDLGFLRETDDPLLRGFYLGARRNLLRPVVIVDYDREAFVHPVGNVRITLDTDLKTARRSVDIFDRDLFTMKASEGARVILEVKFDEVLPTHIRGLLLNTIEPRSAIGKYTISRRYDKLNDWEDN